MAMRLVRPLVGNDGIRFRAACGNLLGLRQFLVQPAADGTFFDPTDPNGRFVATYIGSPVPVKQGYIDDRFLNAGVCPVTSGPGKVVLHQ